MNSLGYLMITQLKNRILALKKKPALLILYLVIFGVIIASSIYLLFFSETQKMDFADERIIYLVIAGLGFLFLVTFTNSGLSTGSTLFSMSDVGLLFVAPITSKKILVYGLISSMGKALLTAFFILFQIGNLKMNFGYGLKEILALFIIYAIIVFFGQIFSIGIYIFTNGNSNRKRMVRVILYSTLVFLLLAVLILQRQEQVGIIEAFLRMTDSSWFGYIPIAGWSTMFFKGVVNGIILSIIIPIAFFLILAVLIISLLTVGDADYYEDVLLSTESTHNIKESMKTGGNIPRKVNKKIKVKDDDEGMLKGNGAMTIAYKHILEMKRESKFIFIDNMTIFFAIGVGIAGYNFKSTEAAYGILAFIIYMQYFFTIMGRLKMELIKPYIYMIPEKSIKKVIAASFTSIIKHCVDAIIIFTILGLVGGADPLSCVFFALAYSSSGAVFVGLTILYQRLLGGQPNRVVQMMIGVVLMFTVLAPGIILSVVASQMLPTSFIFLSTLPFSLLCILFTIILFVSCGNLIDKAEYSGKY